MHSYYLSYILLRVLFVLIHSLALLVSRTQSIAWTKPNANDTAEKNTKKMNSLKHI